MGLDVARQLRIGLSLCAQRGGRVAVRVLSARPPVLQMDATQGCDGESGSHSLQPGTAGSDGLCFLQAELHAQRWMRTAWMSSWTRARGHKSTADPALPPWPVMLVSRGAAPLRRGRVPSPLPHTQTLRQRGAHTGPWLSWSVVPDTKAVVPAPLDVSRSCLLFKTISVFSGED